MTVPITIISDFICPWCLIGESRLQAAIESLPDGIDVEITWQPYELNPDMPIEGMDRKAYRSAKFGSWEYSQALDAQTVEASKRDGLNFNYDAITVTPNTFAAHRLVWFAKYSGLQSEITKAILSAYFEQGRDIGDTTILIDIADEVGLDRAQVTQFFDSDEGVNEVRALIDMAPAGGVHGVPHMDIGSMRLSGAKRVSAIRNAIIEAHQGLAA